MPPAPKDPTLARLASIEAAVTELGAALQRQHDDLLLALDVLAQLGGAVEQSTTGLAVVAPPPLPPTPSSGYEAGAVMGATQAAWTRLEERLDAEFGDLRLQLRSLTGLTQEATATALEAAHRPVMNSEQLRKAAASVRTTVRGLRRTRR
jgi:hypothetical protein